MFKTSRRPERQCMADQTMDSGAATTYSADNMEAKLRAQVAKWRERLLDLGNRNPLINCSFNPSRGVLGIVHPDCESVWRKLAADSEAGTASMRFPWRRELVPPSVADESTDPPLCNSSSNSAVEGDSDSDREQRKEWNPSLDECLVSSRLHDRDLLTEVTDKAVDRRLRTFDGHAKLSMSEQGVHCLYVAFGFLKWFESVDSDKELRSP
ncbi:MAG: DUF4011 domain-containing protein, partial [Planctomycetes bacterium]|nr:DUF4011 domain-containing protein [Planctomycetota bacterium]